MDRATKQIMVPSELGFITLSDMSKKLHTSYLTYSTKRKLNSPQNWNVKCGFIYSLYFVSFLSNLDEQLKTWSMFFQLTKRWLKKIYFNNEVLVIMLVA